MKAFPAEDPLSPPPTRLAVDRPKEQRFLSQLGVGWITILVALAIGAVLLAAQLVQ